METHHLPNAAGQAVSTAMREKAARGYVIGAARLGYAPSRTHVSLGVEPVLDPMTAPLLREAFLLAASGMPVRKVAAWLAGQGVRGNRGGHVSSATVQRVLTEPFYAGFVRDASGLLSLGRHEAITDRRTFALVQRRLLEKRCSPVKKNETPQPVE